MTYAPPHMQFEGGKRHQTNLPMTNDMHKHSLTSQSSEFDQRNLLCGIHNQKWQADL